MHHALISSLLCSFLLLVEVNILSILGCPNTVCLFYWRAVNKTKIYKAMHIQGSPLPPSVSLLVSMNQHVHARFRARYQAAAAARRDFIVSAIFPKNPASLPESEVTALVDMHSFLRSLE